MENREYLQELFEYSDGNLYWRKNKKRAGDFGTATLYHRIGIKGKKYSNHRLIWVYHKGAIPEDLVIDHINRDPKDNRIENLRLVTRQENNFNMSNVKGYSVTPNGFESMIKVGGKTIHLGTYKTIKEAKQAYMVAKKVAHIIKDR